jgi:hypothetical protein
MQDLNGVVEELDQRTEAERLLQAIREGDEEDAAEREKGASGSGGEASVDAP